MAHNLSQCLRLVHAAAASGAKALFLPEASDYIASTSSETVSLALPTTSSPFVLGLQSAAKEFRLPINVGIHEPATTEEGHKKKVKNSLIWIDEEGRIAQRYQKIHLFDVDLKDGPTLKESNSVERGNEIVPPFETAVGRVGMTICFDLKSSPTPPPSRSPPAKLTGRLFSARGPSNRNAMS
ncbi:MAG: hypothetical protein Q9190_002194 [Brigantiaea leucoxantha]